MAIYEHVIYKNKKYFIYYIVFKSRLIEKIRLSFMS